MASAGHLDASQRAASESKDKITPGSGIVGNYETSLVILNSDCSRARFTMISSNQISLLEDRRFPVFSANCEHGNHKDLGLSYI